MDFKQPVVEGVVLAVYFSEDLGSGPSCAGCCGVNGTGALSGRTRDTTSVFNDVSLH